MRFLLLTKHTDINTNFSSKIGGEIIRLCGIRLPQGFISITNQHKLLIGFIPD
ncbi:hypothetical protein QW060_12670 [Myroides ceti]|uniref:Uncharacterized protein n=1 Tax=Paenimyroides ceti TaxID=395087 RepID=A0ABT8CWD2_9FLAO|nr:hypothetical protein [Paenimyroides ceti]MDN3707963.1 hypothetical protein [Paenimyroides ceti]